MSLISIAQRETWNRFIISSVNTSLKADLLTFVLADCTKTPCESLYINTVMYVTYLQKYSPML